MKIITAYPVIFKNKVINRSSEYSNITAASSADSIKSFQIWYNAQSPAKLLKVDGQWGPKTAKAWSDKGNDYEKNILGAIGGIGNTVSGLFGPSIPSMPAHSDNVSISSPTGETKSGMLWDKTKNAFVSPSTGQAETSATVAGAQNPTPGTPSTQPSVPDPNAPPAGQKQAGLSQNAKIGIGVGAGLLLIIIVVAAASSGSKKARA